MRPVNGSGVGKGNRRPSTSWALPTSVGNATRPRPSPSGGSLRKSEWLRGSRPSRLSFDAVSMIAPAKSVYYGFGAWSPATTNIMPSPATSISCAPSDIASIDCGVTSSFAAARPRGRSGRNSPRSWNGGYLHPPSCILILKHAFTPLILHKSRMRRRARTDLSGGRSVMSVPTGSGTLKEWLHTTSKSDIACLRQLHVRLLRWEKHVMAFVQEPIDTDVGNKFGGN